MKKSKNHCSEDRISQTAGTACRLNLNDLLLHRKLIIVLLAGNIAQNWIYISIVRDEALGPSVAAAQSELRCLFSIFGREQSTEQARDND